MLMTLSLAVGATSVPLSIPLAKDSIAAETAGETQLRLTHSGPGAVELEVTLPAADLQVVRVAGNDLTRFTIPGLGRIGEEGAPALPAIRRFLEVSPGTGVAVTVDALEVVTVDLEGLGLSALLEPVQPPRPKCDCDRDRPGFRFNAEAYHGTVAPAPLIGNTVTIRDHRLLPLAVTPVTYYPEQGLLEIAARLIIRISASASDAKTDPVTDAERTRLASPHFDALLRGSTIDLDTPGKAGRWAARPPAVPVSLLIVTTPGFVADLAPFVEWKTTCGYAVTVVTTEQTGSQRDEIRRFLSERYHSSEPPVYVMMVGDSPLLPAFETSNAVGGTDLPYVLIDDDPYPDMMISRWPVDDTTELIALRDKILRYQQPHEDGSQWLGRALFIAGDDYTSRGWTTHQEVISGLMSAAPNNAECDFWNGESGQYGTEDLIQAINAGRGWVVYSAHADPVGWAGPPALNSSDIDTLSNYGTYPIALSHSCQTNMWLDYDDVFGEVAVVAPGKGFVSFWGASADTFWEEDDWLERGFFDALLDEHPSQADLYRHQHSIAAACYSALTTLTLNGSPLDRYYWEVYNLNGDPTLDPYTRRPTAMTIAVPEMISPLANEAFRVSVTTADGSPVVGALVGVSQAGSLLGAGITDELGTATFAITAPDADVQVLVRATAHNHLPAAATISVAGGEHGLVSLDAGVYRCDSVVTIDLFDGDLAGQEPVTVTLGTAAASREVIMHRLDDAITHFQAKVSLGTDLTVGDDQTLSVSYHDRRSGAPGATLRQDTARLDCAGPRITGLTVAATHASLALELTTDEAATSAVWFGTGKPLLGVVRDDRLAQQHHLLVSGLEPCTRYLLQVETTDAHGNVSRSPYSVQVTQGWKVYLSEDLDTDPLWTIDNGSAAERGWAYGRPTGQEQDGYAGPDPTAGYTGTRVYGLNLRGDAPEGVAGENELTLTTPPIDLSTAISPQLRYRRWLGVEGNQYDHARLRLSVDGGDTWTVLWENGSRRVEDQAWVEQVVSLAEAAGHRHVLLQWTYGSSDESWQGCGWNIDDIVVEGARQCRLPGPQRDPESSSSLWR